jgi:hypothetical protein
MMRGSIRTAGLCAAILSLLTIQPGSGQSPDASRSPVRSGAAATAFRDSVDSPPAGWKGPRFKLSHNYPKEMPVCSAPWLKRKVSFDGSAINWDEWQGYVQDIVDYMKEGQDPDLPDQTGWKTEVGGQTRWFHVPWMAYDGERGREFAHGLTNELSTSLSTFHEGRGSGKTFLMGALMASDKQDPLFETWSVGMYNPCGAWSLGQAFPESGEPAVHMDHGKPRANGLPFQDGTLVIKLLNTTADAPSVPYLKNSTDWQANGHVQFGPETYSTCDRRTRKVHLIQIDLAVVDSRSPTRWVYSTLAYNGFLPGKSVLDRVQPLGIQWGNDPHTFPAVARADSKPLTETVIAPHDQKQLPQHLGCQGRLAGVVDQANSSCVSCHMGAFAAAPPYLNLQGVTVPAIFGFPGLCTEHNAANAAYYSDYRYPQPFPDTDASQPNPWAATIPLDSSLQIAVAYAQFATFTSPRAMPLSCPDAVSTRTISKATSK